MYKQTKTKWVCHQIDTCRCRMFVKIQERYFVDILHTRYFDQNAKWSKALVCHCHSSVLIKSPFSFRHQLAKSKNPQQNINHIQYSEHANLIDTIRYTTKAILSIKWTKIFYVIVAYHIYFPDFHTVKVAEMTVLLQPKCHMDLRFQKTPDNRHAYR